MPTWKLRLDRRTDRREELLDELADLAATVRGLTVEVVAEDSFEAAPDAGKFRDFVAVARLSHAEVSALDLVAEEIIDLFGWIVDIGPETETEPQHRPEE